MECSTLGARFGPAPAAAVIAGSGLAGFAGAIDDLASCPYADIAGMPAPTVAGHAGRFVVGRAGTIRFAAMLGRSHRYEGLEPDCLLAGIRALREWGCRALILTNSAGGLNPEFRPGDFMLIRDHINLLFLRPAGIASRAGKAGRVKMQSVYDEGLMEAARVGSRKAGLLLREGIYAANMGPSFETAAEARMLRQLGADAVGMSTAHEALEARRLGMRVLGLSCISNSLVAAPGAPTTHEDVLANSMRAAEGLRRILWGVLREMGE